MKYRDHKGRFRKETDEELKKRCGELAHFVKTTADKMRDPIIRHIMSTNPWLDLLKS